MSGPEESAPTSAPAQVPASAPSAPTVEPAEKKAAPETTQPAPSEPTWPELSDDHPLAKFFAQITQITEEASYNEVYGIELSPTNAFHTKLILQKFLRANANDLDRARAQLLETLKWRKEFNPVKAVNETFSTQRFAGLGYILVLENVPDSANKRDVVTFNIYGAVKDFKDTFGDIDGFLRWRIGIMERSIHKLGLKEATSPIPDYGEGADPYQGYQVHDYRQISFFRMDPHIRAATRKTVHTLQSYYPETLSRKFFVNVPLIMGWAFQAMKLLAAKETARKFTALSYAEYLAGELGPGVPKEYGGEAEALDVIGETMTLSEGEEPNGNE